MPQCEKIHRSLCCQYFLLALVFIHFAGGATAAAQDLASPPETPAGKVVLLTGEDPVFPGALAPQLADWLREQGAEATVATMAEVCAEGRAFPRDADLVVLCGLRRAPWALAGAVGAYVRAGGKVMALGGPYFETPLWEHEGQWLEWDRYADPIINALADVIEPRVFMDFESGDLSGWQRGSADMSAPVTMARVEGGARGTAGAFFLSTLRAPEWETAAAPEMDSPFRDGHTVTTFWARGNANTPQVSIEWTETDGSRWYAKVGLSTEWRFFALRPQDFTYWPDNPSQGRGGPGDRFRPENARRLTVGLAFMYGDLPTRGPHAFWMDEMGTAPDHPSLGDGQAAVQGRPPVLPVIEGLSPGYKFYPISDVAALRIDGRQRAFLLSEISADRPAAGATLAHVERPGGAGFDKGRPWRFLPVAESRDMDDRRNGTVAALILHGPDPGQGGMVFTVPIADGAFFADPAMIPWMGAVATRMLDGRFLYEGGAKYFASFGDEGMPVGAVVRNAGSNSGPLRLVVEIRDSAGQVVFERAETLTVAPGAAETWRDVWPIGADGGPFRVSVTLADGDQTIDRLEHDVRIRRPDADGDFVIARDGDFFRDGRRWYPFGVNYMPSSGIGLEDHRQFEHWIGAHAYDPDIIDRDLDDVVDLGFNMVSAFIYYQSNSGRNLIDFLERCEERGLLVNLSLRPGTPLDFRWEEMREIIVSNRLGEDPVVFAYDLAWEPKWQRHHNRRRHDGEWRQWVEHRHGSLAAAREAWGFDPPEIDGRLTNPLDGHIAADGPWREMVIDYRRFLNALLHEKYGDARDLVRTVAPRQLVSFRMSMAGDPTFDPTDMTYDLAGLADAVDFMQPEAYGRLGDWERIKPGWFTVAYSRAVAPDLPVMWSEFGIHVWEMWRMAPGPEKLWDQARFYDDFLWMVWRSGANSAVCWWFPGGFRVNENSDYGVLNADRSWRPVSHVLHRWSRRFSEPRPIPEPDRCIPFDWSAHVDGIHGIYKTHGDAFWQALDDGATPGLQAGGLD